MAGTALARRHVLIFLLIGICCHGTSLAMEAGIVRIEATMDGKTRFGSGLVVGVNGDAAYVVTTAHVVEGDPEPRVFFQTSLHREYKARVLAQEGGDPKGFALLSVESGIPAGVEALPMAEGGGFGLKNGGALTAFGIPAGLRTVTIIPGTVAGWKNRNILFSGTVAEGNSGGPLVRDQAVAGVIMGVERGFAVAVPAGSLKRFLQSNHIAWATGSYIPLRAGQTFRDCRDCPDLVVILAGSFDMGSPEGEKGREDDEGPVHTVTFRQPFALAKFEITFFQWDACVRAGGCSHWPDDEDWSRGNRPVINVSWNDAQEYVRWLSKETGKDYRLPSEAEWEYAARAGTTTARFWKGGVLVRYNCEYANVPIWCRGYANNAPVGRFAANPFGLHDILGNVTEWTADCWNDSYIGAPKDGSAWTDGDCEKRVFRGGIILGGFGDLRAADRSSTYSWDNGIRLGLRPARTL